MKSLNKLPDNNQHENPVKNGLENAERQNPGMISKIREFVRHRIVTLPQLALLLMMVTAACDNETYGEDVNFDKVSSAQVDPETMDELNQLRESFGEKAADAATTASAVPLWSNRTLAPFNAFTDQGNPKIYFDGNNTYVLFEVPTSMYESNIAQSFEGPTGTWTVPDIVPGLDGPGRDMDTTIVFGVADTVDTLYFSKEDTEASLIYQADWDGLEATNITPAATDPLLTFIGNVQAVFLGDEWRMYSTNGGQVGYSVMAGNPWPIVAVDDLSTNYSQGFYIAEDGSFAMGAEDCPVTGSGPICYSGDSADIFVYLPGTGPVGASWERTSKSVLYNNRDRHGGPFVDHLGRLWWSATSDTTNTEIFYALPNPADGWCLSAYDTYESAADCCDPACLGPKCDALEWNCSPTTTTTTSTTTTTTVPTTTTTLPSTTTTTTAPTTTTTLPSTTTTVPTTTTTLPSTTTTTAPSTTTTAPSTTTTTAPSTTTTLPSTTTTQPSTTTVPSTTSTTTTTKTVPTTTTTSPSTTTTVSSTTTTTQPLDDDDDTAVDDDADDDTGNGNTDDEDNASSDSASCGC
ncbi:MAG: hypothetical protein WC269_02420 [Candidatus Gracilibacteria bacterium]|jgi:hypothetical protein